MELHHSYTLKAPVILATENHVFTEFVTRSFPNANFLIIWFMKASQVRLSCDVTYGFQDSALISQTSPGHKLSSLETDWNNYSYILHFITFDVFISLSSSFPPIFRGSHTTVNY